MAAVLEDAFAVHVLRNGEKCLRIDHGVEGNFCSIIAEVQARIV